MRRTSRTAATDKPQDAATAIEQMYSHPGFLLRRAHQIAAAVFEQECEALLTPPQFSALSLIGLVPNIDQMSVARITGLDRNTIAVVITNLIKQGWVTRTPDPTDGRRYCLEMTAAGRSVTNRVRARAEKAEQRLLSGFSASEATQFVQLLRTFVDNFNEDSRSPVDDTALPAAQLRLR